MINGPGGLDSMQQSPVKVMIDNGSFVCFGVKCVTSLTQNGQPIHISAAWERALSVNLSVLFHLALQLPRPLYTETITAF